MTSAEIADVKQLLSQANSILVILGKEAEFDQQLAAASLYLYLKDIYSEMSLDFVAPQEYENQSIIGLEQLKTKLGKQNLLISFTYDETAVDKITSHIDDVNQRFYLTIKPQKNHSPLDAETIQLDYVGSDADVIFLIGVKDLDDLEKLYFGYEPVYEQAALINISNAELDKAEFNHDVSDFSSYSEAILAMMEQWSGSLSSDIATNLLAGIQYSTKNFIDLTANANTFERVASLLRSGARRSGRAFKQAESKKEQEKEKRKQTKDIEQEKDIFDNQKKDEKKEKIGLKKKDKPKDRPGGLRK